MEHRQVSRVLLAGGVAGPLLFIVVFLVEDFTRPGYDPWRLFVSQLSTGPGGWVQIASFIVCALLILGFAVALWLWLPLGRGSRVGPALLIVFSVGLLVAGVFSTDPAMGYPPGTPERGVPQTLHGTIHGFTALVVFISLAAACFVMARWFAGRPGWTGWRAYSITTGVLVALGFVGSILSSVLDEQGILPNGPTGLFERISIFLGWSWIALFARRLLERRTISQENPIPPAPFPQGRGRS